MIRPISVASDGFISNSLRSLSIASNGMLLSTAIIVIPENVSPIYGSSVDHNLRKKNKIKEQIKRDESEIMEIISFIAKRIL
jgi:hypothetical protein